MKTIVGIGELAVSDQPEDWLLTYSLGSCLGLTAYDPQRKVAGLLHCLLPSASIDRERAAREPAVFVDTGVELLFQAMMARGALPQRLVLKAAGCANLLDDRRLFRVGERNYEELLASLQRRELRLAAADVGGQASRSLAVEVATGRILLRVQEQVARVPLKLPWTPGESA